MSFLSFLKYKLFSLRVQLGSPWAQTMSDQRFSPVFLAPAKRDNSDNEASAFLIETWLHC